MVCYLTSVCFMYSYCSKVVYNFRTGPNGPDRTEGIKFGPDRANFLFGQTFDLENFYLD